MKILLAVDGSEYSRRAVECLISLCGHYKAAPEIHLLNVQPALPVDVAMHIAHDEIVAFHEERGIAALRDTQDKLDAAGLQYAPHICVGDIAQTIVSYAAEKGCAQIVMGTRGMGSVAGMLLGSVATKVVHLSSVPVLLVK